MAPEVSSFNSTAIAQAVLEYVYQHKSPMDIAVAFLVPLFFWLSDHFLSFAISDQSIIYLLLRNAVPLYGSIKTLFEDRLQDTKGWIVYWSWITAMVPFSPPPSFWRYIALFLNTLMTYPDPRISKDFLIGLTKVMVQLFPALQEYIKAEKVEKALN